MLLAANISSLVSNMLTSDDIYSINVLVFEAVCKLMLIYMRQCLIKPLSSRIMSFVTRRREERTDGGEKEREREPSFPADGLAVPSSSSSLRHCPRG